MADMQISCAGAWAGALALPPFILRAGGAVCLHLPSPLPERAEEALVHMLTGGRTTLGYRIFGRVLSAMPATDDGNRVLRLFRPLRATKWLRRRARVTPDEAAAALRRIGLERDWPLDRLAGNPRLLLALEAAWMGGAEAVVFGTVGCDPGGVQAAFAAVASRLESCPAIYLSRTYIQGDDFHRNHFPGATCVELRDRAGTPFSAETA